MGPGRTIATSTARSSRLRGRVRRSIWICALLSIWNSPTVSPRQMRSYTAWSAKSMRDRWGGAPPREAGQLIQLVRQLPRPPVRQLGDLLDLSQRQIERLADLAHRGAEPVGGEGADQPHVLVAVALVDPPDQLLADLAREVEVDVGYRCEALVQEPAQEQAVGDRVDVRQAEQVADDGRHRRAAPAAGEQVSEGPPGAPAHVGRHLACQVEQVVIDQEEPTESMVFD